jgi:hypothetical protein
MTPTEGDRSTERKTCPTAILSTTNSTGIGLWSNPGLRDESVDIVFGLNV